MDALTRHRVLALAGIVHARAFEEPDEPVDDFDEELDEDTAALVEALASFDDGERSWDPAKHPRNPKGTPGGGRFKSAVERIVDALTAWSKGEGSNDPLQGFDREQLRLAAKKRGLTIRRGAPRDEIAKALLDDLRVKVRAERGQPKPSAKFTLQGPQHHNLDVAVYRQPGSQAPELYQENDAGKRGALVRKFDNLDELAAWADANGEPRLAEWARKEAGNGKAVAKASPAALGKAPHRPASMSDLAAEAEGLQKLGLGHLPRSEQLKQLHRLGYSDAEIEVILDSLPKAPPASMSDLAAELEQLRPELKGLNVGQQRAKLKSLGYAEHEIDVMVQGLSPAALPGPHLEQAARDRQAAIDSVRTVADTLAEVDQLVNDGASVKALQARLDSRRKLGAPADVVDELAAAARADQARVHEVEVENRIRQAYRDIRGDRGYGADAWVGLADLREQIGDDVPRAEVDDALRRMLRAAPADPNRPGAVRLIPVANTKALKPRDRAAQFRIGDSPVDALAMADPSPRPIPSADRSRIDQARADIAKRYGLTPLGSAGAVEPFDPNRHEMIGGARKPRAGTPVQVVRPGHEADINGEKVQVGRAGVMVADTPAVALLSTDPKFREEFESALKKLPRAGGPTPAKAVKKTAPAAAPRKAATPKAALLTPIDESVPLARDPQGDNMYMHGDSASMGLAQALARHGRNGSANKVMDLRRKVSVEDANGERMPVSEMLAELRRMRDQETDPALVRNFDEAIAEIDAPDRPIPELPANTPPLARQLIEDLNKIPYARKRRGERTAAGSFRDDKSLVEQVADVYRDAAAGRRDDVGRQPADRLNNILRGKVHESNDGSFQIWALAERLHNGSAGDPSTLPGSLRAWERGQLPTSAPAKPAKKTAPRAPKLSTSDIIANADLTPGQKRARLRARGMSKEEIDALVPLPSVSSKTRDRVLKMASLRALGHDVTPGHDELHHYWVAGPGLAKWVHSPKPWTTLYTLVTEAVRKNGHAASPEQIRRWVSRWFIEVFHFSAGSDLNRVTHGHPPRGHRIGPG